MRNTQLGAVSRPPADRLHASVGIRGLTKTYPGTRALDNVDLDFSAGRIHAVVGGNGSGKSTLIKTLAGVLRADAGALTIGADAFDVGSFDAVSSRKAGVRVVHQDLGVFPALSVAENIALGSDYPTTAVGLVGWRSLRKRAAAVLDSFQIDVDPGAPMQSLRLAAQTRIAIARALQSQDEAPSRVLILDEPTAALPTHEATELLGTLRGFAELGLTIIYVSHRLDEILEYTDDASVMRDGAVVASAPTSSWTEEKLISAMIGKSPGARKPRALPHSDRRDLLEIRGLKSGPLEHVDLTVARGEIVGIAGLTGSGRSSLLRAVFGASKPSAGQMIFDGRELQSNSPQLATSRGIAMVPENRAVEAAFADLPIRDNLLITRLSEFAPRARILRAGLLEKEASDLVARFAIKAVSTASTLSTLSGGNQQKVIMARWMSRDPKLLLLDEPTQGVDISSRDDIHEQIREAVDGGAAAIVVSSDFDELALLADRVVVIRNGRISAELTERDLTVERITQLATFDEQSGTRP
jgi:ribose transport system ATP-binding protein